MMRLGQLDFYEWNQWFSRDHITKPWGWMVFYHGTGGLKVTVSRGIIVLSPQMGIEPATHVHIPLPRGSVVRPFHPYFPFQ
jgi:hypothetical protein